ncbi:MULTISPECIES: ArsR/SmtB family transcription factor [Thermosediminibacter]|uniref:Transcriptional regulator, ArsR family n=2 Tax=Thermosediminibacter TaxID=291988 RepID=D9S043_THEOJ|nr:MULTISPECIES: metalloregulator ArsR/SmtB family transcription factor [Thermosediminibacter]ADL06971.1 transcriptional regulator, ArsR family [Thermosediminibacter oceani DSM 16646]TYP48136.1 transcriptional regulator, ArsR family [Thermosediminibacter litoriperuensis]
MVLVVILKALADENRLRILNLLRKGELCVCEIEAILEITQSNASRHLNKLKNAGIITYEKKSQWVYYKINETFVKDNALLFDYLNNYMDNNSQFLKDLQRLKEYKNNRITCA